MSTIKNHESDSESTVNSSNFTVIDSIVFRIFDLNKNTTIIDASDTSWSKIKLLVSGIYFNDYVLSIRLTSENK